MGKLNVKIKTIDKNIHFMSPDEEMELNYI